MVMKYSAKSAKTFDTEVLYANARSRNGAGAGDGPRTGKKTNNTKARKIRSRIPSPPHRKEYYEDDEMSSIMVPGDKDCFVRA